MARRWSVSVIQLTYCVPVPILAPRPSRKGSSSGPSNPPCLDSTMPERRLTTRMPAARAGAVACSQSRTSVGRNPAPLGALSSTAWPAVLPYHPTAEAASRTGGGAGAASMARISAAELSTRLARSSCLRAGVQRRDAIGAPDRCTTASTPSSAPAARPPSGLAGSHRSSVTPAAGRRTSRSTSRPSLRRYSASAPPMSPVAPVIATRTAGPLRSCAVSG